MAHRLGTARRLLRAVVAAAALAGLLPACSGNSAAPKASTTAAVSRPSTSTASTYTPLDGTVSRVLADGRTYLLHARPSTGPVPLLVVLHIAKHTAAFAERASGFSALADKDGFAVAYGQGVNNDWNAGGCCGSTAVDDVGYLRRLVRDVESRLPIDRRRVYVSGDSEGAMMAYRAVCEAPDVFVAAGVVGGVLLDGVRCAHTVVRVLEIHAEGDTSVPLAGGRGIFGVVFPSQASERARVAPGSLIVLHT